MLRKRSLLNRVLRTHFKNTEQRKTHNTVVFLDLQSQNGDVSQRIEIELLDNVSPLGADNFRQFANGFEKQNQKKGYKGMHLKISENRYLFQTEFMNDSVYKKGQFLHENYEGRFFFSVFGDYIRLFLQLDSAFCYQFNSHNHS